MTPHDVRPAPPGRGDDPGDDTTAAPDVDASTDPRQDDPRDDGPRVTMIGGPRRTLWLALGGVLLAALAAAALAGSLLVRPSPTAGAISRAGLTIDPNNPNATRAVVQLQTRPGSRYDFYLTTEQRDPDIGDYASIDIEAERGDGSSRYVTYAYVYFGDAVQRRRTRDGVTYETYELARNQNISSRHEQVTLTFQPTSAWFQGMAPLKARVEVVEVRASDLMLLMSTSVMQVAAFPLAFSGLLLLWLAGMRQLRLIGIRVSPPPARRYQAPPGRAERAAAQARAAAEAAGAAGVAPATGGGEP